jgi:hypothetical protein
MLAYHQMSVYRSSLIHHAFYKTETVSALLYIARKLVCGVWLQITGRCHFIYKQFREPKQYLLPPVMPTLRCAARIQRCQDTVRIQEYRDSLILASASIHTIFWLQVMHFGTFLLGCLSFLVVRIPKICQKKNSMVILVAMHRKAGSWRIAGELD